MQGRQKENLINQQIEDAQQLGFASIALESMIELQGYKVRLNHFPYANPEGEPEYEQRCIRHWPKPGDEDILLHGHVHQKWREQSYPRHPPMINVGVDLSGLAPISASEILRSIAIVTGRH